jgi:hypothetical protein
VKHFILCFKKEMFCTGCFRLRYFTIKCNTDEYKMRGQDLVMVSRMMYITNKVDLDGYAIAGIN